MRYFTTIARLTFLFAAVVHPTLARCQPREDAAQIHVRVPASQQQTLPTIRLVAVRSGVPDPDQIPGTGVGPGGSVTFAGLPPGTYALLVGDRSLSLSVSPRERVVVDAGALAVVGRQSVGEGLHLTDRWFTDPASSRDVWALVETIAPFVIADRMDNGGLGLGRSALLGARGSSWTTTQVTVGGASVIAANERGLMPFADNLSTTGTVSVMSGLMPVEYGTPGVVVSLTPRAPAATRQGFVDLSLTTGGMVGDNALPFAPSVMRTNRWADGHLLFEGPIGARTGLLVSGARAQVEFQTRNRVNAWTSTATSATAHVTHRPTDTDRVRALGAVQGVVYPYDDRRQFLDRGIRERGTFAHLVGSWHRTLESGAHLESLLSLQHARFRPDVTSPLGGTLDRVWDGFVPAPAANSSTTQWELATTMHLAPRLVRGTQHDIRFGANLQRATLTATTLANVDVAELVGGLPARVWRPSTPDGPSRRAVMAASLFAADRLALGAHLTIDAGVRADLARGTTRGGAESISWPTLSPRLTVQWHAGPLAVFAGAGWYSDPLTLARFPHGDPGEATFDVHRWTDPNGDGRFSPDEVGALLARTGRGADIASIDPDLAAPRTFEYTGGLELRFGKHVSIRSAIIWRSQREMLGSVNTGVTASSYTQRLIPDAGEDWLGPDDDRPLLVYDRLPESFGLDRYLLTNPDDATATYEGIETSWLLHTSRVEMLFGATAYRTRSWSGHLGFGPLENDHSVLGEVFERPNARPLLQGSNFFDRSYVGKWAGSVHLPFDTRFGFAARYQDGQPFSRVVVVPDLSTGPEMIHAYRTGRTRYTYTLTLDLRLQKAFTIAGRSVAMRLDVFNATNHKNEVDEHALTTPLFRLSTAVQPPRTARVGVRIAW